MKRPLFLADLDDTLFRSAGKHASDDNLVRMTTARNERHGLSAPHEMCLIDMMRATGTVIPVTARSREALSRVHLDFGTGQAICANGAVILDHAGRPDRGWAAKMSRIGHAAGGEMRDMMNVLKDEFEEAVRTWIVEEEDVPVYLCMKVNDNDDPDEIARVISEAGSLLMSRFDLSGFQHHVNGNNLSLVPSGISKRAAAERFIENLRIRPDLVIGIGDSVTDLGFMGVCDFMMTPSGSQIAGLWNRIGEGAEHV